MELDDMKNIWKDKPIEAADANKISAMISRQSQSPVAKMKRNLRMELLILIFSLGIRGEPTISSHSKVNIASLDGFMYCCLFYSVIIFFVKINY